MPNAFASFDALFIARELSLKLGNAAAGEIHLFAYLGCLLSLFEGKPAAEWGYNFAGLESGSPFSPELYEANMELDRVGFLASEGSRVVITDLGKQEIGFFDGMKNFESRKIYLNAACASLLSFPVGIVRNALSMEPGLRPVLDVGGTRPLLANVSLDQLHQHFEALLSVLGQTSDLLVPSTVWLTYLLELARKRDHGIISRAADR